jgi:hypothetical protein
MTLSFLANQRHNSFTSEFHLDVEEWGQVDKVRMRALLGMSRPLVAWKSRNRG